jgi:hypothetical protein
MDMSEIPPELMMVADDMILVDTHRVQLGMGAEIGKTFGENGPAFFVTIEGRVNKSDERRRIELLIPAELGYRLGNEIMDRLEQFIAMAKAQEQ